MAGLGGIHRMFGLSSRVTSLWGRGGARTLDVVVHSLGGNPLVSAAARARDRRAIASAAPARRVLVLPDMHIGDAILTQSLAAAVRRWLPGAEVDFPVHRAAAGLLDLPGVHVLPFFGGGSLPGPEEVGRLRSLARSRGYRLVLNCSPFLANGTFVPAASVVDLTRRATEFLRRERRPGPVNHLIAHFDEFADELFAPGGARPSTRSGVSLVLDAGAAETGLRLASAWGIGPGRPGVLVNADGSSAFSRIPFGLAAALLERVSRRGTPVLVGEGMTASGIGERLRSALPPGPRDAVRVVPASLPLDAFIALIDACDVFLTGDTGLLHAAAARKRSRDGGPPFRNRTAVLSCFGATPPRLSGYDSRGGGFLPADQDAPSRVFLSRAPCRNLTCIDKMFKTCRTVRCFEGLDAGEVAGWIERYLEGPKPFAPARPKGIGAAGPP